MISYREIAIYSVSVKIVLGVQSSRVDGEIAVLDVCTVCAKLVEAFLYVKRGEGPHAETVSRKEVVPEHARLKSF